MPDDLQVNVTGIPVCFENASPVAFITAHMESATATYKFAALAAELIKIKVKRINITLFVFIILVLAFFDVQQKQVRHFTTLNSKLFFMLTITYRYSAWAHGLGKLTHFL